jgi:hypothetical protein|tara:strand:+ start:419 stop:646 length:228 start_codon:yes stop_codon:yes gene_type:complete
MIESEKVMKDYIKKNSYMVIFPDQKVELFSSLRKIQNAISVDSSTISKKLKESDCNYFKAKGSEFVFFIKKLDVN